MGRASQDLDHVDLNQRLYTLNFFKRQTQVFFKTTYTLSQTIMYFTQIATIVAIAAGAAASPVARQNSGQATFYQASGGTGSCGQQLSDSQMGVAVSSNMGCTTMCGKNVQITSNGQTVSAPVVDCCPSCESNHIDLLPKVFESLGISQSQGVAEVSFSFQ